MGQEFPWFPQDGKFPKLGNFPGILVREIPGRENFEAIQVGGNGNFALNIPVRDVQRETMDRKFPFSGNWEEKFEPREFPN